MNTRKLRKILASEGLVITEALREAAEDDPCWDGYEQVGMKEKDGKQVPNCVPKKEAAGEDPIDLVNVGDFLVSSWGYDQTNVDFYEVVAKTKKMVAIREVEKKYVGPRDAPSVKVMPVPGRYTGPALKKKPKAGWRGGVTVRINSYSSAHLWDGKPQYQTGWGYGH